MDMKLVILIFLNMCPPQKLVLVPGAIIGGNTVYYMALFGQHTKTKTITY